MKNIFFICFCALFAFSGCADDDDDLLTGGNVFVYSQCSFCLIAQTTKTN